MMARRGAISGIVTSGVVFSLGACGLFVPHWTYRYRLTVDIMRHGKIYSGSSVIEIRREKGINGIGAKTRGEAVTVDIGDGNPLFALLRGSDGGEAWPYSVAHKVFADHLGTRDMVNENALTRLTHLTGISATLPLAQYPMLVRFRDIGDPRTVESVDPTNLPADLGPDIHIERIIIQITDAPVTTGIRKRLVWLGGRVTGYLDGEFSGGGPSLANILDATAFERRK